MATITASRSKALSTDVKEGCHWPAVENTLERLYMDKKDSLRIEWDVKYKTNSIFTPIAEVHAPVGREEVLSTTSSTSSTGRRRVCSNRQNSLIIDHHRSPCRASSTERRGKGRESRQYDH